MKSKSLKKLSSSLIILLIAMVSYCQGVNEVKNSWRNAIGEKFEDVQLRMEEYYLERDKGRGSGYKQWKRWESEMMYNILPDGTIPNTVNLYEKERQKMKQASLQKSLNGNWQNVGPNTWNAANGAYAPGIGRLNCIAFHPTDANTIYTGAALGGLWRSYDAGNSWTPLFQEFARIGVSGIVVGNTNTDLVYVLSGDGDGGGPSGGVYKSIDNGDTWVNTAMPWGSIPNVTGYKLLMDPNDDDILYALTSVGVYKTTNGGANWSNILPGAWRDMEFKPGDSSIYYVAGATTFTKWNGSTWTETEFSDSYRLAISVTADNPNCIYLIEGKGYPAPTPPDTIYRFGGFWKSSDEGDSFTFKTDQPNILSGSSTGEAAWDMVWYDLALVTKNDDENEVLVGGIDIWGSTNSGSSFANRAHWALGIPPDLSRPYVHADIHALEQNPLDNKLYCASDGGIFVSSDFGITWSDISAGISIGMYYRIDNRDGTTKVIMGAQDNGSMFCENDDGDMTIIWGGDGMECHIAHDDPDKMLFSAQLGSLYRTTDNGASFTSIKPGNSLGAWTTPVDIDPNNSDRIATAYQDIVYISNDFGDNWTAIPFLITSNEKFHSVHFADNGDLYVARHRSIFKIDSANNIVDITYNLTFFGTYITSITSYDNGNPSQFVLNVCMAGSVSTEKVFYLIGNSTSWGNLSTGLPNVPMYCMDYDKVTQNFYAGHALGVHFWSPSTGWKPYSNGMPNQSLPNTPVYDIEVNETNRTIYASAWGRGLFVSELESELPPNDLITNAILLECGQGYQIGTTTAATSIDYPGLCGSTQNSAPGVWYKMPGMGADITLGLCGASHDSQMSIWEDVDGTLICIDGENDDPTLCLGEFDPNISFPTIYGHEYYVYVYGYDGAVGDFTIDIDCAPHPNDPCAENTLILDHPTSPDGYYHGISNIESNAIIINTVIYKAGNFISLNPDFEVAQGVTFEAIIDDCP